ncbi:MAG TPA: type II toxin-antitoxin system HicB family antitoxin [Candidatus Polarisedimenticolia bacterium]|nr:type II toxin-antitoxin system HicB family antitoxin [Candidatus Polarisedimenticolia bacterium]
MKPRYRKSREHGARRRVPLRETIHAVVHHEDGALTAECMEVAVVTQGRTLDELVLNLREAVSLHLQGESLECLGLSSSPRLSVIYEIPSPLQGTSA